MLRILIFFPKALLLPYYYTYLVNGTMKPVGSHAIVARTIAGMMEEVTDRGSSLSYTYFSPRPSSGGNLFDPRRPSGSAGVPAVAVAEAHQRRGRPNFLISWPCALERALRDDSGAYLTLEICESSLPGCQTAVQVRGVLGGRQYGRFADLGVLWRRGLFWGPQRAGLC